MKIEPCSVCNQTENLHVQDCGVLGYCVVCADEESFCNQGDYGNTQEEAVEKWNREQYE